ncbi:MAG: YfhO family protein [Bacteroidales bacterium]|nr:YfhO family protein [Bacteroidales bacterium]
MNKFSIKQLWPYLASIVFFLIVILIYFSPVLDGQLPKQDDIQRWRGMSKEILDFRESTGEEALWTNSMFGGMPAYQITVIYKNVLVKYIDQALKLGLPHPVNLVFLYFLGFFILLLTLKLDVWNALFGAVAFALSSYFFIIIEAGHNSKAHAIGYMAPVLAGILLTFRGKYFWGGAFTALFLSIQLMTNHLQITYYLLLMVVILGIAQFIESLKSGQLAPFFKAAGVLAIAAILAIGVNISNIWATYEYGKYTIRGPSELTADPENRTSGLDIDYATQWSYGVTETFTLLIPDFMGGGSMRNPNENSATYGELVKIGVPAGQAKSYLQMIPMYWGTQPFTSGPVYTGAIIVFLFVLGLFIVKGKLKWWLIAATVLSIMLSWGHNFMPLTEFFLHYVPGYNKFRAVSMTLVIADLAMPLLGVLALKELFNKEVDQKVLFKYLKISFYITGGIALFFVLFSGWLFNFYSRFDDQLIQAGFPQSVIDAIRSDRQSMLVSDAIRSLIFITLAAIALWAALYQKFRKEYAFTALILLVTVDMYAVNRRYLNDDDFEVARKVTNPFTPSAADQMILQDPDPNFRVMNTTVSTFNDASTSYFHKSIGGYHGAKLRRYQELIDRQISKNNMSVLNMLNTKYFIVEGQNKQPQAMINPEALGNAWMVKEVKVVANADEEIEALSGFDPKTTAVVDQRFAHLLADFKEGADSLAAVKLTSYKPNELIYSFESGRNELVVFSEIHYDKGWNAYIDGNEMPYLRANYVLRAMMVPAGNHEIVWKFEPNVYQTGGKISLVFSLMVILFFFGALGNQLKDKLLPGK